LERRGGIVSTIPGYHQDGSKAKGEVYGGDVSMVDDE